MLDLKLYRTAKTPEIDFRSNGICVISGNSVPEDLDYIYLQAENYLKELIKKGIQINFTFDFDYYNTLSQRYIFNILELLSLAKIKSITWNYIDIDEDMLEMGEQYQEMFPKLKIKLKKKCLH